MGLVVSLLYGGDNYERWFYWSRQGRLFIREVFPEHKIQVTGFYSKSEDSSLAASNFTSSKQYLNLRELVDENDTIFITTPDGQIQEVWQEIKNYQIKNKLICHCSGAISSDIFSNIQDYGAYGYSVHPMFSISDKYNSYKN